MTWEIERDSEGLPVRLWWRGKDEDTFASVLAAEVTRCEECGYPNGFHKMACTRLTQTAGGTKGENL